MDLLIPPAAAPPEATLRADDADEGASPGAWAAETAPLAISLNAATVDAALEFQPLRASPRARQATLEVTELGIQSV